MRVLVLSALIFFSVFAIWQGINSKFLASNVEMGYSYPDLQVAELRLVNSSVVPASNERASLQETFQLHQTKPQFRQYHKNDLKGSLILDKTLDVKPSEVTPRDSQVIVAILDTGIDSNHEELIGQVSMETNFTESDTADDVYGHGTHIAGIIAANDKNNIGIVGLASESRLLNVKVADDCGRCSIPALVNGIIWAADHGANIINISIELKESTPELKCAVDYAWQKGAVIVAAAGNDGSGNPVYPAYYENCIGVAAIKEDGMLVPLSNYGRWVDVSAPGFNIYSTMPNNKYGYKHGTSFATAYISGMAANLFPIMADINSNNKRNDEVRQEIIAGGQIWY